MAVIVGHRGVAGHAPENTMAGFRQALEMGLTHVEVDVRVTRDGVPVVHHDQGVAKLTHGTELIRDMTLAEVKALRVPEGREIPTLAEALDLLGGKVGLLLDCKAASAVGPALDAVEARHLTTDTLVASFDADALVAAKRRSPHVKTCLLFRHPIGFLFRRFERRLWADVERAGCEYVGPRANIVTRELVDRAHALGRKVYAYHANTRSRGERLMSLGVEALGVDDPTLFGTGAWVARVTGNGEPRW